MSQYSYTSRDFENAIEDFKKQRFDRAEKVFKWFYEHRHDYNKAKIWYAKCLFFCSCNDREKYKERCNAGLKILNVVYTNKNSSKEDKNEALITKADYLTVNMRYHQSYEIYNRFLNTNYNTEAVKGIGTIEAKLGDIWSANDWFLSLGKNADVTAYQGLLNIALAAGDVDDSRYYIDIIKKKSKTGFIPIEEVYLNMYLGNYKEALELFKQYTNRLGFNNSNLQNLRFFLELKNGIDKTTSKFENGHEPYIICQIKKYNEVRAKRYFRHLSKNKHGFELNQNIDTDELFDFLKECLQNNSCPYKRELMDYYVIRLDRNMGKDREGYDTDMISVGVLSGTKDQIITMKLIPSLNVMRDDIERKKESGNQRNL